MTNLVKALNDVDHSFRLSNEREIFDAWFAGNNFAKGKCDTNINLLRSIFQGYNTFITSEIDKSNLSQEQKTFEKQKLFIFNNFVDNICTALRGQPGHDDNLYFLIYLTAYVNNALRQNHRN